MKIIFKLSFFVLICFNGLAQQYLPVENYKYLTVKKLIEEISLTFGDFRAMPELKISSKKNSGSIAEYIPGSTPYIVFDEKLYDICREFNKDSLTAIALIIGHELTHHYRKHEDFIGFARLIDKAQVSAYGGRFSSLKLPAELQADKEGFFRAYLAGYEGLDIVKRLYTIIYNRYNLKADLKGYLSLNERIAIIEEQAKKAHALGVAFEIGNFFFMKKDYDLAEKCFEYVKDGFPSKELFNNLGLTQLFLASSLMNKREMPFRYPFELELKNRLNPEQDRGERKIEIEDLLRKASQYFNNAINLDNKYSSAYINLASTQSLQKKNGTAVETIDELEKNTVLTPNAHLIRGIALARLSNTEMAKKDFERIKGAYEEQYNYELFKKYPQFFYDDSPKSINEMRSWIDSFPVPEQKKQSAESILGSLSLPLPESFNLLQVFNLAGTNLIRAEFKKSENLFIYRITLDDKTIEFLKSRPEHNVATGANLQIGDSVKLLEQIYGKPHRIIHSAESLKNWCYDDLKLLAGIKNDKVNSLIIWK